MTQLPFLFALAVILAAALASIAIWAPRRLLVRAGALACAVLFMPVAYAGLSDLAMFGGQSVGLHLEQKDIDFKRR